MDGLFIDTEELHFQSWQWLVANEGAEPLSLKEYMRCVGKPGKENIETICTMKGIMGERGPLQLLRRKKYEELRKDGTPLIQEHIDLAKAFAEAYPDMRQVLVSSSSRDDVDTNIKLVGLDNFFELSVSYNDNGGLIRKPSPDMYHHTLKRLELPKEACLAFEDSNSGVVSAVEAGIPVVALPNRLTVGNNFSKADAVFFPGDKKTPALIMKKLGLV